VSGVLGVNAIGAGHDEFACAVSDGTVRCWGINDNGQITGNPAAGQTCSGDEGASLTCFPSDDYLGTLSGISSVSPGGDFTCALSSAGSVYCWGTNTHGECATGSFGASSTPALVTSLTDVTAVAAGYDFACAIEGGSAFCWGDNASGQLGNDTVTQSAVPMLVSGLGTVIAIAAGQSFACAVSEGGYVQCWGDNTYGQLGNGTTNGSPVPVGVLWPVDWQ
jgi:alpha-tubulin suppressor-like RCC1 family protein